MSIHLRLYNEKCGEEVIMGSDYNKFLAFMAFLAFLTFSSPSAPEEGKWKSSGDESKVNE